jgi:hypothetical protein
MYLFASGPEPLLVISGLGNGYSTPAVTGEQIFVTGEIGDTGYLFAFDLKGSLQWRQPYGQEWTVSYRGSRASPVVIDSLVYTVSGMGDISCFHTASGMRKWVVSMIRDLHGVNAVFGYSMPVTVEGDWIYCIPGGQDTNIACLDRFTGKLIWKSEGNGEPPGYTAPLFIRRPGRNLLVVFSELAMHGLDAGNGALLWTHDLSFKGEVPCNKPIYSDGSLFMVAGPGNGASRFEVSADGGRISKSWSNMEFDTFFGGVVMTGNYLYGSSQRLRKWISVDASTGLVSDFLSHQTGATILAGEILILYNQSGKVAIVKPHQGKMNMIHSFVINQGTGEHFSCPAVAGNKLFLRHGDALVIYDLQQLDRRP